MKLLCIFIFYIFAQHIDVLFFLSENFQHIDHYLQLCGASSIYLEISKKLLLHEFLSKSFQWVKLRVWLEGLCGNNFRCDHFVE